MWAGKALIHTCKACKDSSNFVAAGSVALGVLVLYSVCCRCRAREAALILCLYRKLLAMLLVTVMDDAQTMIWSIRCVYVYYLGMGL